MVHLLTAVALPDAPHKASKRRSRRFLHAGLGQNRPFADDEMALYIESNDSG
jgi:hypothetical protein